MKTGTPEKLKFKKLQRALRPAGHAQMPLWQAVGLLEALWLATYANAPDGDIGRLSNDDIASAIEYAGDADQLVAALLDARWLDPHPTFRLIVHDWSKECANFHKGNYRKYGKRFADEPPCDAPRETPREDPKEAPSEIPSDTPSNLTKPHPTTPNQTQPHQKTFCGETAKPSSPPPTPEEPAVLEFPCDGAPSAWRLTGSQVAEWGKLFPSLDLLAECRAALAWVMASPTRRKTARGMPSFLVNWFTRSQNRGHGGARQTPNVGSGRTVPKAKVPIHDTRRV